MDAAGSRWGVMVSRYEYSGSIQRQNSLISSKVSAAQRQPCTMELLLCCSDEMSMIKLSLVIIIISM